MCHEPHVSMDKSQTFMPGTILFPCPSGEEALQQEINKDNRLLWATLTPHGTRHFVSAAGDYSNYEDHYEVVDYRTKPIKGTPKKIPIKVKMHRKELIDGIGMFYSHNSNFSFLFHSHLITAASVISIMKI